ncbi:Quinol monooxygenase YgiN [Spirosomataceae bacterium TFI 002]|nr:Quinol monooxygenase YgiN [Spirosomataceae bacterium TFI 002]
MVTLIATITAKEDTIAEVKKALLHLHENTNNEPGCIKYILHQEVENPTIFRFYEQFKDQEAFEYHGNQPYIKAMGEKAHLFEKPTQITFLNVLA